MMCQSPQLQIKKSSNLLEEKEKSGTFLRVGVYSTRCWSADQMKYGCGVVRGNLCAFLSFSYVGEDLICRI